MPLLSAILVFSSIPALLSECPSDTMSADAVAALPGEAKGDHWGLCLETVNPKVR